MRALLDISVLLALTDPRHTHHARVRAWRQAEVARGWAGWASCPLTQNGFLRIVTQKSYANPVPLGTAIPLLARLSARPDHQFWPDDLSILDAERIDHARVLGHRQLTDIYLLGLAVKNGGRLVTLDSGIAHQAVRDAEATALVVL
jgi:hypothetical protein